MFFFDNIQIQLHCKFTCYKNGKKNTISKNNKLKAQKTKNNLKVTELFKYMGEIQWNTRKYFLSKKKYEKIIW